jgi:hypothetical protein
MLLRLVMAEIQNRPRSGPTFPLKAFCRGHSSAWPAFEDDAAYNITVVNYLKETRKACIDLSEDAPLMVDACIHVLQRVALPPKALSFDLFEEVPPNEIREPKGSLSEGSL